MVLLSWGTYQDLFSRVPYTDIDYHVFTGATSALYSACPWQLVTAAEPQEEYEDLADPPEARGKCAQGVLPAVARLMLQTEDNLNELQDFPKSSREQTGQTIQLDVDMSNAFFAQAVPHIFTIVRPFFRLLAGTGNPYSRDTYRYTPYLAVLLLPGQLLANSQAWFLPPADLFGKLLFVLADILVALLLWDIMDVRLRRQARNSNASSQHVWLVGLLWLVNPFPAQISTRGSSESILGVIVLCFVDLTLRGYPEETSSSVADSQGVSNAVHEADLLNEADTWGNVKIMAPFFFALAIHWKLYPVVYAASIVAHLSSGVSKNGLRNIVQYAAIALYSLVLISGIAFGIWGWPYIQETVLYHVGRSDHRHNFSPFFLSAYLSQQKSSTPPENPLQLVVHVLEEHHSVLSFVPQLLLTAYIGFSVGGKDLIAGLAFQTIAFVAWNKVCTSQYYMWFLWFLPLLAPSLRFDSTAEIVTILVVWVSAQAIWLSQAYLLEFKALDTFLQTWAASVLLLIVHAWILISLVRAWARGRIETHGQSSSQQKAK